MFVLGLTLQQLLKTLQLHCILFIFPTAAIKFSIFFQSSHLFIQNFLHPPPPFIQTLHLLGTQKYYIAIYQCVNICM